jgi:RsiW-degrading membrane proteinase PrsW (M82 family)
MQSRPFDWSTAAFLGFSGLALLSFLTTVLLSFTAGIMMWLAQEMESVLSLLATGTGIFVASLLLLPGMWYGVRRMSGVLPEAEGDWHIRASLPRLAALALVWLVSLLGGYAITDNETANLLLKPILNVLAAALPVWLIVEAALHGVRFASRLRATGVFSLSMTLGPLLIILLELVAALVALIFVLAFIATSPEWMTRLSMWVMYFDGDPDPERMFETMAPYLLNPWIIFGVLAGVALIVPLIEEIYKLSGVWMVAERLPHVQEGYALGILSGAGFALMESLGMGANAGTSSEWAVIMFTRAGTTLLHIACGGLMGWALAEAWLNRRFLQLGAVYALVVVIHGVWNGATILSVFGILAAEISGNELGNLAALQFGAVPAVLVLTIVLAFLLVRTRQVALQPIP